MMLNSAEKVLIKNGFKQNSGMSWSREDVPFHVYLGNYHPKTGNNIDFFLSVEVYDLGVFSEEGFLKLINVYESFNKS